MIKILFAASKYDYANPNLGLSNEYYFFYDTLKHMENVRVELFDWVNIKAKYGHDKMNELFYKKVKKTRPNLVFFSLFENEFKKNVIKSLSAELNALTLNVFSNDDWQFDNYSKYWAPEFSYVATDVTGTLTKYHKIGYKKVFRIHWGVNPRYWKKLDLPKIYDVSFVGQAYGNRKGLVTGLKGGGINIMAFGRGFKKGKLPLKNVVRIYNQSKINLNFSIDSRSLQYAKFLPAQIQPRKIDLKHFQMKARPFEVTGSGGFLLSTYGEPLKDYFKFGSEIETFKDFDELVEKAKFYLSHDSAREKIAKAGYQRTSKNYTYEKRLIDILKQCGLK